MKKVLILLALLLSFINAKQLSSQEFQDMVIGIAEGQTLTKEKYSAFWEFANKQGKNKKYILAIMKNGVYTNLLLQVELFKSVLNSYDARRVETTATYDKYMSDSKNLMIRDNYYYLTDNEYKQMIKEYSLELDAYSQKHKELLSAASKRQIDRNEWEANYMALKVILGNLKILFAENYQGDF